jgi:hypothetical protein
MSLLLFSMEKMSDAKVMRKSREEKVIAELK